MQVYLELWQQVLSNTMDPPDDGDEDLVSGIVTQSDSRATLRSHFCALKMFEVNGTSLSLFPALQAAIDKQSWPFIPHIRETHLVQSEKFPRQPDVLLGCNVRSYALDQRRGTLKLLTLRGIVTIRILSDSVGSIGIDPNVQHALNNISGGCQKIIREASFARRKGNGSNASQFLVFGLLFGSMSEMGYIFCKDPEEPSSGPTGHVTLTYPPSMMVQESAIAKRFCCPYGSGDYASMRGLISHFQNTLRGIPDSDDNHPREEISEFIRNSRQARFRGRPVH